MEYIYGNPKAHPWKNVASIFAAHDSLNSAQTSSLPLVQFWRASGKNFEGKQLNPGAQILLEKCLGEKGTDKGAQLCFEYAVPVHKNSGRGKASMTDLMILTKKRAIAVEAKWKECKEDYQTIKDWLGAASKEGDSNENRRKVLRGWIQYIEEHLGNGVMSFDQIAKSEVPYQMLHRIASACHVAQKSKEAVVIYQLFYDVDTEAAMNDFAARLADAYRLLFDGAKHEHFSFYIVKTKVEKSDGFEGLKEKCKKDQSQYDWNALFLAMQKSPIYAFSDIELIPLDPK